MWPSPRRPRWCEEADVRLAGVNVGKVKKRKLLKGAARTEVELEIKNQYAPIPKNTSAILRQKTLLGETYVELAPGDKSSGMLKDGARLANNQVEPTVELDEIFNAFDRPTRTGLPGVGGRADQGGEGRPRPGPERRLRQPRGLRRRRGDAAEDPERAGRRRAPPDQEHRCGVRRRERAPGRAAPAGRQLQQHVLGHGLAGPRAGRDHPRVPHLPRRVEGHPGAAGGLLAPHPPAGQPAQALGRRPGPDGSRPGRPRARPRGPVPRPEPAYQGLRRRACPT